MPRRTPRGMPAVSTQGYFSTRRKGAQSESVFDIFADRSYSEGFNRGSRGNVRPVNAAQAQPAPEPTVAPSPTSTGGTTAGSSGGFAPTGGRAAPKPAVIISGSKKISGGRPGGSSLGTPTVRPAPVDVQRRQNAGRLITPSGLSVPLAKDSSGKKFAGPPVQRVPQSSGRVTTPSGGSVRLEGGAKVAGTVRPPQPAARPAAKPSGGRPANPRATVKPRAVVKPAAKKSTGISGAAAARARAAAAKAAALVKQRAAAARAKARAAAAAKAKAKKTTTSRSRAV